LVLAEVVELARLRETMAAIAVLAICRYLLQQVAVAVVAEMVRHCLAVLEAAEVALVDLPAKLLALEQAARETTAARQEMNFRHFVVVVVVVRRLQVQTAVQQLALAELATHSATATRLPVVEAVVQLEELEAAAELAAEELVVAQRLRH
jgi:hypothetical protein